jgi:hypothetical protein
MTEFFECEILRDEISKDVEKYRRDSEKTSLTGSRDLDVLLDSILCSVRAAWQRAGKPESPQIEGTGERQTLSPQTPYFRSSRGLVKLSQGASPGPLGWAPRVPIKTPNSPGCWPLTQPSGAPLTSSWVTLRKPRTTFGIYGDTLKR